MTLLKCIDLKKFAIVGLSLCSLIAQAALFDDKEARKKITEIDAREIAHHDKQQATLAAMEKRIAAIEAIVQSGGLTELQNQIEALKQEIAHLKGDLEVVTHNLETTQQRQKDLYSDTDTRLRRIESTATNEASNANSSNNSTSQNVPPVEEKDVKAFTEADSLSKSAKYKEAFNAYDSFLREFPTSKLVPDALYGMGYSQFALKNYKSSIATQLKIVDLHPDSSKVPEAMFNIANSQIQLGQVTNAKKTLKDLILKHPEASVTPSAQKRLKALEAIR